MNVPGKLIPVAVFATLPTLATAAAMDVDIPLPEPTVTGQWTKTLPMDKKIATMKYLGDLNDDLTFTPVTPCRLADTRNAGGALASFAARSFSATDATMINAAGGNAAGCGIPAGPTGLALTITAVAPTQPGNLIAYAYGAAVPLAGALHFL